MERIRYLNQAEITELRRIIDSNESSFTEGKKAQAILMLNGRNKKEDIQMITWYSRRHLFTLRKSYLNHGIQAIKDRKRRVFRLLTRNQRDEIIEIIQTKNPSEYEYGAEYWTPTILGHFIKATYNVEYKSKTSLHLFFKEAKFTYHKPDKKYQRRNDEEVVQWTINTKPIIEKAWNDEHVVILAEDEMILSTQTTTQKIWLPRGEFPHIEIATKRKNRSLYGFLNIKTGDEHCFKTEYQNMYITTDILKKIKALYPDKKIILFWDQAGWHRGSVVQEYIKQHPNSFEIIYFPAASPDLNPQEHVWKAGRSKVTHNTFISNIDTASDQFVNFLNTTKFPYPLLTFNANLE